MVRDQRESREVRSEIAKGSGEGEGNSQMAKHRRIEMELHLVEGSNSLFEKGRDDQAPLTCLTCEVSR